MGSKNSATKDLPNVARAFERGGVKSYAKRNCWNGYGELLILLITFGDDGNTEHRAGSQRPPITSSREDRNVTRMTLMDRAATSRSLNQKLVSFTRQQVSV
ncbi:hypothetical protein TNCV_2556871 [Trichonephila clavipes]|nr:hypothetical protein TNCV_2556871 [Trichonephila clavipes]